MAYRTPSRGQQVQRSASSIRNMVSEWSACDHDHASTPTPPPNMAQTGNSSLCAQRRAHNQVIFGDFSPQCLVLYWFQWCSWCCKHPYSNQPTEDCTAKCVTVRKGCPQVKCWEKERTTEASPPRFKCKCKVAFCIFLFCFHTKATVRDAYKQMSEDDGQWDLSVWFVMCEFYKVMTCDHL